MSGSSWPPPRLPTTSRYFGRGLPTRPKKLVSPCRPAAHRRKLTTAPGELLHTVEILQKSAQNVRAGFLSRVNPDDIESQNYQSITDLNNKCERDLYRLRAILPEPPNEDASRMDMLRTHFLRRMREDNVQDIISGIKLCNSVSTSRQGLTPAVGSLANMCNHRPSKSSFKRYQFSRWNAAHSRTTR